MNDESYVDNLHQIISNSGKEVQPGSSNLVENFLRKIADDIFLKPPLYSKGYKFKYMLLNYLNLKPDTRSRFEDEIISKWKSFQGTLKEAIPGTTSPLKNMEKTFGQLDQNQEANQPEPARKKITLSEKIVGIESTSVLPKVETPPVPDDKKAKITKHVRNKAVLKRSVPEQTGTQKAEVHKITEKKPAVKKTTAPKKTAARMPATKKPAGRKKLTSVSGMKIPENKRKRQAGPKTLKTDVLDLTMDMRSLEEKIAKMMKTFDSLSELKVAGLKTIKKRATPNNGTKRGIELTDAERVVKIIMRRKKNGIDVSTLSEKTGFNAQKIRNIVSNALKNGKIRRISRGLYCSK